MTLFVFSVFWGKELFRSRPEPLDAGLLARARLLVSIVTLLNFFEFVLVKVGNVIGDLIRLHCYR